MKGVTRYVKTVPRHKFWINNGHYQHVYSLSFRFNAVLHLNEQSKKCEYACVYGYNMINAIKITEHDFLEKCKEINVKAKINP